MKPMIRLGFACAACLAAAPVQAQRHAPDPGTLTAGASLNVDVPADDSFTKSLALSGSVEAAVTPRVAVRAQVGVAWWNLEPLQGLVGSVHPLHVAGNIVYRWETGASHPYVTGGAGVYRYAVERVVSSRSTVRASQTHAGLNVGGGFEFFETRRSAVTAEVLYHRVPDFGSPLAFTNGSFWSFAIGMNAYLEK